MQALLGERARWGDQEHLMASIVDVLTMLNHNLIQSNSRKKLRPPSPMKRPGIDEAKSGETKKYAKFDLRDLRKMLDKSRGEAVNDGGS